MGENSLFYASRLAASIVVVAKRAQLTTSLEIRVMTSTAKRSPRILLFLILSAICFSADLATKSWVFGKLGLPGERGVWWQIPKVFGFQTSLNRGALFGIGQGQIPLFVALSAVALLGIVWWIISDASRSRYLATALGLITGGILGNLWDRVGLHGMKWTQFDADAWSCTQDMIGQPVYAVRDWILVMIGDYAWPNFNIADACLVSGAILIGGYALFAPTGASKLAAAESAEAGEADEPEAGEADETEGLQV